MLSMISASVGEKPIELSSLIQYLISRFCNCAKMSRRISTWFIVIVLTIAVSAWASESALMAGLLGLQNERSEVTAMKRSVLVRRLMLSWGRSSACFKD